MKVAVVLYRGDLFVALVALLGVMLGIASAHAQCSNLVHVAPAMGSSNFSGSVTANEQHFHLRPLQVDVDLVLVPTTVTDSLNRPITDLQKQDFLVLEGDERQDIKYFTQEDMPISVGILLDTSGSMKSKFELAREALSEFFRNANRDDDYFVITYSDKPQLLADTTQSVESIEDQLATVKPSGSTPLLDALYLGLDKLKHARYQRRALLIISDGGDNDSRYKAKEIRSLVQESDVQIYAMGIFNPLTIAVEDRLGKKLLTDISGATGGRAVFFSAPDRMPEVASMFSRELRSQYVLGYRPRNPQPDGKLHRITVKVTAALTRPVQLTYKRQYLATR
jgi:Ca-activated chloride channel homolog